MTAAERNDPTWATHYERTAQQLQRHGHLRRAGEATRRWADEQIRALRAGTLPDTVRDELAAIGMSNESITTTEATLLAELDWWVARHSSADVPQMAHSRTVAGTSYWLGKRVSEARVAHGRGTLAPALARQLEQRPGWSWRVREDRWDQQWETKAAALAEHVTTHGSLDGLEQATYQWLIRQRAALAKMPEDRKRRLKAIPGALDSRDTRVRDFVAAARAWLDQGPSGADAMGRTMADLRYVDTVTLDTGTTVPLGKRATYYRRRHAGLEGTHPLTAEEKAQIEELPAWTWQLQARRRQHHQTAQTEATPERAEPRSPA